MEEPTTNGDQSVNLQVIRKTLLSNSTKKRVTELDAQTQKISNHELSSSQLPAFLEILLNTYSLYVDGSSRQAVERCISATIGQYPSGDISPFVIAIGKEAAKSTIAPGNAFVLVRWSSLLVQGAASHKSHFDAFGPALLDSLSSALTTLLALQPRESTVSNALRVSRRAVRMLAQADFGPEALTQAIKKYAAKASSPVPRNAVLLGIIAGVCTRLSSRQVIVEDCKEDYISFYLREILGSRVQLPTFIGDGLHDFFASYVSMEDLKGQIVPAFEKALLRAPEVVLNDLVTPVVLALPQHIDLSEVLCTNLLKPLSANIKSTNATIREGAARTFCTIAVKCHEESLVSKIGDEILNPLKTGKVTSAEQRILYAQMLSSLEINRGSASKLAQGVCAVAIKEANEPAAAAEILALSGTVKYCLENDVKLEASILDTFAKGVAEKRLPMRRLWAFRFADIIWGLDADTLTKDSTAILIDACIGKLIDTFNEAVANPVPASQNGQVAVALAVTALCLAQVPRVPGLKSLAVVKKANIAERAFALEPKASFLINPRVLTKLTAGDDFTWAHRALIAAFTSLPDGQSHLRTAWGQAVVFVSTATGVSGDVRTEAISALQKLYATQPALVSLSIVEALWQYCEDSLLESKDTVASANKYSRADLYKVVRAICLPTDTATTLGIAIPQDIVDEQLTRLIVLCKPTLMPQASWIELCLRTGTDPGRLVNSKAQDCLDQVLSVTENPAWRPLADLQLAAYASAAELAFVAPESSTAIIMAQIAKDLDPNQLEDIGPTEAAIYRTPEGVAFIDVLSKQTQTQQPSKNSKDYDTMQWEEELRAQIAKKKGESRKLKPEEQAKVNAQLAVEADIRKKVTAIDARLRRGVGFITALATGPPTEAEAWFGPSVKLLFDIIQAGAALVLGDAAALGYLQCANKTSSRLGPTRPFVGVATLRATGVSILPENLLAEPLGDLVTRVLYRLRFLGEQKPLDALSLNYVLPLIFLVLEKGGVDRSQAEEADEQIILAIEVLSFHTETCSDSRLPRQRAFSVLLESMGRFTQHFKIIKDCFMDLTRCVAPSMDEQVTDTVVKGAIAADPSVRNTVLQAISAEMELSDREFYEEIWLACHDDNQEHIDIAREIWEENELEVIEDSAVQSLPFLKSKDVQLRRAAARSTAESVALHSSSFEIVLGKLQESYIDDAKPKKPELDRYGMPVKKDMSDPWESRHGIALALKELGPSFPSGQLVPFMNFMIESGPLGDRHDGVRDSMVEAATAVVSQRGQEQVEPLMKLCESTLEQSSGSTAQDLINEAVVILYGALARHLAAGDDRVPKVVQRLLSTLSTPSESVQYAVAQCLPPLVLASSDQAGDYLRQTLDQTLHAKKYAARRGAAYGLGGIIKGKGIAMLKETRLLSTLRAAAENKKDPNERQGTFLAYELLSLLLGRVFEPYVIQIVPQLLSGFGDTSTDVREACLDAAKTCFATLSSYGVKQVLPMLLEGLEESQWRSKKGASDSLGAMAYLDPEQLAVSLPEIIPPLTEVLNDSHKEVRASANRSLQRFGDVISNPEVKSQVNILLKALSDPTKYTDDALDALIKVNFIHYLDAPSLALVSRILERGLGERSATKRKAAQIIGSLAHLTERKDILAHLPILVAGLRVAAVDPVPTTRATSSKALGSLVEKLGEDALPDLIPSLMQALRSDTGAGDRLGSAQALSEVLAGLGTSRLEETLPSILQNVSSSKASVREGFMSLFIFLPACFGNGFANYLGKIIPSILGGLADETESIRETALRAGRLLVKNFASRSVDLLLPELERGLADDSHRIRLSSVELVGDLLFNLSGISGKADAEEAEESAQEAGQSLLEVLGEERRNKVLSALYICRCDTSGLVRTSAMAVWKALVASPRTLRELTPTLTQLLIRRLASSNMEQKVIAGNALGELIRKAGEGVLATLLPTLEEGLQTSTDTDARQGICIALRELITSAVPESLEEYEKTLISVVRTALVDPDEDVREAAAEAFDSLQRVVGKRAIDQVLPHLLSLLRSDESAENALAALLTLLTETTRSNVILPNLLPTLLTSPISAFNARALASLAEVASSSMTRRLPNILNALMDNIVVCKDNSVKAELDGAFDTILLSVDEYDGLNTIMSAMMVLVKHDDHRRRSTADFHLAKFIESSQVDFSRYYPDLIRVLLIAFDDLDPETVKAAWTALNALVQRLRKEEMESLVVSTRQALNQVGVAGHDLPGFSLPKGINAVLPIFLQGLMNGSAEQRTQAALAISDLIARTSADGLRPFVTQITGPLIRVVSERSTDLKAAILLTLNNLLEKIPTFLKPFLPQLQRTFAKSLADPSSEVLRSRAARALGTLITMTPRIDPLIAELVTGSKTTDPGVRNAMLKALYEVVSKAGANMSEVSRNSILALTDSDSGENDDALNITYARLLGALIKVLSQDVANGLIKARVLTNPLTKSSVLSLNAVLLDSPESLSGPLDEITAATIVRGMSSPLPYISDNAVLAAGKYLLSEATNKSFEGTQPIFEKLAQVIPPGSPVDTRRLALVVIRTVSRENNELVRPHLATLVPPIFASVRDPVIPVKLTAEAAFLAVFSVVEEEGTVFEKYMAGSGASLQPGPKRSIQEYFKRIALRQSSQARERKEAEGGQGGLGLSSDEREDEREVWSVGKVDLNEGGLPSDD